MVLRQAQHKRLWGGWQVKFGSVVSGSGLAANDPLRTISIALKSIPMSDLHIAEIPFENGGIQYRYSRRMSADGTHWIREGLFQAFHPNGILASEGNYVDGKEHGLWRDYHDNGHIAAEGEYVRGVEASAWRYWASDGTLSVSE